MDTDASYSRYTSLCLILIFFFFKVGLNTVKAQCSNPSCLTNQLVINTGYDHPNGIVYPPSTLTNAVQDPHWLLVNAPTNNGPVSLGSPAFVIETHPAWDDMLPASPLPSRYISAFARAGTNEANISGTPYVFQRKICICSNATQVTFQDFVHVDNQAELRLFGPGLPTAGALLSSYNTTTADNFRNPAEDDGAVILTLNTGTYFLQAEMRNDNGGSPMGLNIQCTITADKVAIADETCCNNGAFVSGFKFLDANCNGVQESTELLDIGWTINLRDAGGIIATTTTDISGYYFFNITTPGTYTIEEVAPLPWSQTFPSSPNTHTVTITGTEVISNLNFGNCCTDCLAFQNNAGSVTFNTTQNGRDVTITPTGGLLPSDTYSVDINSDNNFEITNVPAGQSTTYTFPHYGSFNITIKATRIACGKACEVEINQAITIEEPLCVDSDCYEWNYINEQYEIFDMCFFDGNIIVGGVYSDLSGPMVGVWDDVSWQYLSSFPTSGRTVVYEVEPYNGSLYALVISQTNQTLFRWTGFLWASERSFPINQQFYNSGPIPFYHLSEMEQTSDGLFAAFYKDTGVFSGFNTSHEIHHFDGSSWTVLPDPIPVGGATSFNYFQMGQYNDQPVIRIDLLNGTFAGNSSLAAWNGSSWARLVGPFIMNTAGPVTQNANGITYVTQTGTDLIAVGSFSAVGYGAPLLGTAGIAKLTVAGPASSWQSVGGGETSGFNGIHITRAHVFGQNIIINGPGFSEMGGTNVFAKAWYDGTTWNNLGNAMGPFHSSVAIPGTDDLCEVYMGGETHFGKVTVCCQSNNLNLNVTETDRKLYLTNGSITSSSTITATADVTYRAENGITFTPGFNVLPGAKFSAIPTGCEECCPPNPLTDLSWLAPFVGDPNYSITQCMSAGSCIYKIEDFCLFSDGITAYYNCSGNLLCTITRGLNTCINNNLPTLTNCVELQACPPVPLIGELPREQSSLEVFPNPLTDISEIRFNLPKEGRTVLRLIDINGQIIQEILNDYQAMGMNSVELDASSLPSGMYFLILQTPSSRLSKKVILTR